MAVAKYQQEDVPVSYPATPSGLSTKAAALDPAMIWARIETHIAHRWTPRAVVWIIDGPGEWVTPLTPATISTSEVWNGAAWISASLAASPLGGFDLTGAGPYRITASVGVGTPPAPVNEAFKRLAEYIAGGRDQLDEPGATSYSTDIGGDLQWSVTRNAAWMARALQNSGAADLLRPYRRA